MSCTTRKIIGVDEFDVWIDAVLQKDSSNGSIVPICGREKSPPILPLESWFRCLGEKKAENAWTIAFRSFRYSSFSQIGVLNVCTVREQGFDDVFIVKLGGSHQSGVAVTIDGINVCSMPQDLSCDTSIATFRCPQKDSAIDSGETDTRSPLHKKRVDGIE
eukprot:GHVR01187952.1.p2 GENE.GHVR01187952.1~~GHVR01187952.1.p2  ORF type:complete len:161 (+),score=18.21 GHVR01187952.1:254-736(+)